MRRPAAAFLAPGGALAAAMLWQLRRAPARDRAARDQPARGGETIKVLYEPSGGETPAADVMFFHGLQARGVLAAPAWGRGQLPVWRLQAAATRTKDSRTTARSWPTMRWRGRTRGRRAACCGPRRGCRQTSPR
jgi:hypothetical protein